MADAENSPVLIIGAGLTGLLIAHGLKKASIPFKIFEAEPSATHYRPREWSMGVHWGLPLLISLLPDDLVARLSEAQSDPFMNHPDQDTFPIWGGEYKKPVLIKEVLIPKTIRFSRRRLRALCAEGIDVQYDHSIESIRDSASENFVTAVFQNGQEARGSVVIGTDGPKSQVRESLMGSEGRLSSFDVVHTNIAACYHDAERAKFVRSAHPTFSVATSTSDVMSFLSIQNIESADDPANWRFQVVTAWHGRHDLSLTNEERLAELKRKAENIPEPYRSAVLWLPDDQAVSYDTMAYWVSKPWNSESGRVTLAGDAAHPMTPYRGQGLNNAICDASNFVKMLVKVQSGELDLKVGVDEYGKELVVRGAEEVKVSNTNGEMMMNHKTMMSGPLLDKGLNRNGGSVVN